VHFCACRMCKNWKSCKQFMASNEARHSLLAALPIFVFVLGSDTSANRAVRAETRHFGVFQHFLARFLAKVCAAGTF